MPVDYEKGQLDWLQDIRDQQKYTESALRKLINLTYVVILLLGIIAFL